MTVHRLIYPLIAILLTLVAIVSIVNRQTGPDIELVANASLKGMREQNRLTTFAANYSTVVTSEQKRFGLTARKTLIMQGLVRYEVDMTKLAANDVRWDAKTGTLFVRIPDIEVSKPQIDPGI